MVYRRRMRKFRPRRLRRRRYVRKGTRGIKSLIHRQPTVCPDKMIVKLPYVDTGTLDNQGGVSVIQTYNLNSLYDPDRTGTGHQPIGFDQWKEFYNRYRVFKVAYEVMVAGNEQSPPLLCGWYATPNVAANIVDNSWFENPRCRKFYTGGGTGQNMARIRGVIYNPKILGETSTQYKTSDNNQAVYTSNPNTIVTVSLGVSPLINNTNYVTNYYVKLVYYAELFDRFQLSIS